MVKPGHSFTSITEYIKNLRLSKPSGQAIVHQLQNMNLKVLLLPTLMTGTQPTLWYGIRSSTSWTPVSVCTTLLSM